MRDHLDGQAILIISLFVIVVCKMKTTTTTTTKATKATKASLLLYKTTTLSAL
jgi:hypothetical protein